MSGDLILHVRRRYFDAIRSGLKRVEYRERTDYWKVRIEDRVYDQVVILLGYPRADHYQDRRLTFPWRGWRLETVTLEDMGWEDETVYAIPLEGEADPRREPARRRGAPALGTYQQSSGPGGRKGRSPLLTPKLRGAKTWPSTS